MEWVNIAIGILGVVVTIALAFGSFFLRHLNEKFDLHSKRVEEHAKRFEDLEVDIKKLPETYARRDDVKSKFDEVLSTLNRIDGKIDNMKDQRYRG